MTGYTRQNPFYAAVVERFPLGRPGSLKNTYHIVLDLTGSGISYAVGDSLGVLPQNDPALVKRTLQALGANGEELVSSRYSNAPLSIRTLLTYHCSLATVTRALVALSARQDLLPLLADDQRLAFKAFIAQWEVWDFLETSALPTLDLQAFIAALMPLLPRLYSIASHQATVNEQVHLTVAYLQYTHEDRPRLGACTHYLCSLVPIGEWSVPVYIQPHKGFTLPIDPTADIIMIGPGTGVAPYRGFMQQRRQRGDTGRSWLFFGEWHRVTDFFYAELWQDLAAEGCLQLTTAFSRDQPHKIYVQHRLFEYAEEVYRWIREGAYIFVCGDAKHMAKDVEATLLRIFVEIGNMSEEAAAAYLKELRHRQRYVRDVY